MLRTMRWTGLLMMAGLLGGCAHLYDHCDQKMLEWKCCHDAKMAWLRCRDLYAEVCNPHDFGAGFRAGYESVCMGGDGCAPAMPPRHYWSSSCLHSEGKCATMAWYDGFHHGVLAAQCDGCEGRCNVLCAYELYGQKPPTKDFSDVGGHVPSEGFSDPGLAPIEMPSGVPYDATSPPPPSPAVPEYYSPPAAGTFQGDFSMSPEADSPTIPGLRDMSDQSAVADEYPTF